MENALGALLKQYKAEKISDLGIHFKNLLKAQKVKKCRQKKLIQIRYGHMYYKILEENMNNHMSINFIIQIACLNSQKNITAIQI